MSLTMLEQLKFRVGATVAAEFSDDELQSIIGNVETQYGLLEATAPETILDVCQAKVCITMATDSARYFKYQQGAESVDKTRTPEQFRQLAKLLLEPHQAVMATASPLQVAELATPKEYTIDRNEDGDTED